jgi:hypothetical protein
MINAFGICIGNKVRNNFGHRPNYKTTKQDITAITTVLDIARKGVKFKTPIDAIEAFTPVACSFHIVPDEKLQSVFLKAFSGLRIKMPRE